MGAAQSSSVTKTNLVNRAVSDVMMDSSSNCSANQGATQEITVKDISATGCKVSFNDISQDMNLTQNFSCMQEASNTADLNNKFATALDNQVTATLKGIPTALISNATTTAIADVKNEIKTNINIKSLADCVATQTA